MSDGLTRRRIRAQSSPHDDSVMGFVLDAALPVGAKVQYTEPEDSAPLTGVLFALPGVSQIEIAGATIWVRRSAQADWAALKPAIAAAIRQVLDQTDKPLGDPVSDHDASPDMALLRAVENLLDRQVNPSVAHSG